MTLNYSKILFNSMINGLFILIYLSVLSFNNSPEISICSWNLQDFGNTKNEKEINFIANTIKSFDIIAVQEVVASNEGEMAVERLRSALSSKGESWEYAISEPTSSSAYKAERYAFLWKTEKVRKTGNGWLGKKYGLGRQRIWNHC